MDVPDEFFESFMRSLKENFVRVIVSTGLVPTTVTVDGEEVE